MNLPERLALAHCHTRILALGVDAHNRAIGGQQIGNDRADALARACRRDGQKMDGAIIAEHPAKCVAPDQQIAIVLRQRIQTSCRKGDNLLPTSLVSEMLLIVMKSRNDAFREAKCDCFV